MSDFEFAFSLFGLLLGFTLVEVLSGLARSAKLVRTRNRQGPASIRLGWLTPLLALFVLLDVSSYWQNVWSVREHITVGFDVIFGGLLITGTYYFAASMVFPEDLKEWPNLDDWFWSHRQQALLPLFVTNAFWMTYVVSMNTAPDKAASAIANQMLYFVPLALAVLSKRSFVVGSALALLSAAYIHLAVVDALGRIE